MFICQIFTSDTKEFHFHKRDFDWLIRNFEYSWKRILTSDLTHGWCRERNVSESTVGYRRWRHRGPMLIYVCCVQHVFFMLKHWSCWKYQYNKHMLNIIDIYIFIIPLLHRRGYTVLPLSFCPSLDMFRPIFLSNYWWQKSDIWSHMLHIGTPYRGKRFWSRQIPTSCLPT
jgi:hypothetical protein